MVQVKRGIMQLGRYVGPLKLHISRQKSFNTVCITVISSIVVAACFNRFSCLSPYNSGQGQNSLKLASLYISNGFSVFYQILLQLVVC